MVRSGAGEIVDLGADMGIMDKSGAWYGYNGTKIAQGREAAKQFLQDNPEVADEIEAKIKSELLGIFTEEEAPAGTEPAKKKPRKAKVIVSSDEDEDTDDM